MNIDSLENWLSGYFTAWSHFASILKWPDAVDWPAWIQAFSALTTLGVLIYLECEKAREQRLVLKMDALDLQSRLYEVADRMSTQHLTRYKILAPNLSADDRTKLQKELERSMRRIQSSHKFIAAGIYFSERKLCSAARTRISEGLRKVRRALTEEERLATIALTKAELSIEYANASAARSDPSGK